MDSSLLQLVSAELENCDIQYQAYTTELPEYLEVRFSEDNLITTIRVIALNEGKVLQVSSDTFAKIPLDKLSAVYPVINTLNCDYRFVKFTLDEDNEISAHWDLPDNVSPDSVGRVIVEIVIRMSQILDTAYPKLMKALWS